MLSELRREAARVFLAVPHYGSLGSQTVASLFSTGRPPVDWRPKTRVDVSLRGSSALTFNFNALWAMALNARKEGVTHFAMLHADVSPASGWLDTLLDELHEHKAAVVSTVLPIKDGRGLTTTAIGKPGKTEVLRRLTVREARKLPKTFSAEDAGYPGQPLLINTGCWVCDLRQEWVERFPGFTVVDALYRNPHTGEWSAKFFSEDWWFGLWLHGQGLKAMATTAVAAGHHGAAEHRNDFDWGLEADPGDGACNDAPAAEKKVPDASPVVEAPLDAEPRRESQQPIRIVTRQELEQMQFDVPTAVIELHDPDLEDVELAHRPNLLARWVGRFHDIDEDVPGLVAPTPDASGIVSFCERYRGAGQLVVACEAAAGRSQAVAAALLHIRGLDDRPLRRLGTYNIALYRHLLRAAGEQCADENPLVSIAVRIKYGIDRFKAFLLSMQRQRHRNWELVAVSDGENANDFSFDMDLGTEKRLRFFRTPSKRGRWGHPYRQTGFTACSGEVIGTNNDDNYLTPGYIEQLIFAMEDTGAQLAFCDCLHAYRAWSVTPSNLSEGSTDLGCWLARRELIRQVPWEGDDFQADGRYFRRLVDAAAGKVVHVQKPLLVKN